MASGPVVTWPEVVLLLPAEVVQRGRVVVQAVPVRRLLRHVPTHVQGQEPLPPVVVAQEVVRVVGVRLLLGQSLPVEVRGPRTDQPSVGVDPLPTPPPQLPRVFRRDPRDVSVSGQVLRPSSATSGGPGVSRRGGPQDESSTTTVPRNPQGVRTEEGRPVGV